MARRKRKATAWNRKFGTAARACRAKFRSEPFTRATFQKVGRCMKGKLKK